MAAIPSPERAAALLGVIRYAVTAPDPETHTRLALAAPWANWVTQLPGPLCPWLVTVFAVDNDMFLRVIAQEEDGVAIQVVGEAEEGCYPPLKTVQGSPEAGWQPWALELPQDPDRTGE